MTRLAIAIAVMAWVFAAFAAAAPYTTPFMRKQWLTLLCAPPYTKTDEPRLRHCLALHRLVLDR